MVWEEQSDEDQEFEGQILARAVRQKNGPPTIELEAEGLPSWVDVKALRRRASRAVEGMAKAPITSINSRLQEAIRDELLRMRAKALS